MNKKRKTLFVNFYSGPGAGKSTLAAAIFAELKFSKISSEIISEYAKQLVWEESFPKMRNQIYVLGKQHNKQFSVNGKVDVAVTDSPFILSLIYDANDTIYLKEMAMGAFNKFWNLNIFLERLNDYDPEGRTQKTVEEAIQKDVEIRQFLLDNNIPYVSILADKNNIPRIMELIKTELTNNGNNN